MFGYVTSPSLRNRAIRLARSLIYSPCTLLPFFDDQGVVRRVMVVRPDNDEVNFFDPTQVKLRFPIWFGKGMIEVESSFPTLQVLEYEDLEALSRLWHFDPWWLLTSNDKSQNRWTQRLLSTNCAERFVVAKGKIASVWYDWNLTRLTMMEHKLGGSSWFKRFNSEYLPKREEVTNEEGEQQSRFEWRLVPFWTTDED